nr:transcriptional regulator [Variovorax sp. W1I1]
MTLGQLAADLEVSQARISEWKKGKYWPDASQIMYFAQKAGLPEFDTLAELEAQHNEKAAPIWQAALGKLRAAGVAATLMFTLAISSLLMSPTDTKAAGTHEPGSITSGSAKQKPL